MTLNRPERMNSLSLELLDRMAAAWVKFRDDEDAWVAVVTATGDKAFCTGFDLIDQAERDKKGETAADDTTQVLSPPNLEADYCCYQWIRSRWWMVVGTMLVMSGYLLNMQSAALARPGGICRLIGYMVYLEG